MVQDYAPENPVVPVRWAGLLLKFGLKFTEPIKSLGELADVMANYSATPVLESVADGLEKGIKDGRIPPGRMEVPELRTAIAELVRDLESEIPDQRRFEILRRAVVGAAIGLEDDPDGTKALLFVRTARRLKGEEALVLAAAFRCRSGSHPQASANARDWKHAAMKEARIPWMRKLEEIASELTALGLIKGDGQTHLVSWEPGLGVLTDYGLAFCEFLERAEPLEEGATGDSGATPSAPH